MKEFQSCISIRLADGEEVFHHGKIADNLYNSFMKKSSDVFESMDDATLISYSRSHVSRVIYQQGI